ncbi:Glycosyltransferase, catalytic subunit of cellulose synthase and poly-beta-1,6-N-acetylglucosamine synthase [Paenimyroides ummariense]|uniref:Glycosyltransferase, catalytic subunit of cellulose synthase and poly-beta-1,6-N-acetylglucosamine synthase n=1 Tax=Paenimyroides ummariense TaxID=913024 RepID=A0A1I5G3G7_9FLAO|nr:glycosyltransferase [Paenimyroides ummariense]SFO30363.1 Glycosyltransferase, catalytic subunit of cellulose synthase and poly-beta-1,6-N-acetylglucosamine synthase [Paenimyroides ummariense]
MYFSFIIPVYNRPDEIDELLQSLVHQTYNNDFEIVVVEDGSTVSCKDVVNKYINQLNVSYYFKENSGPGDSRNYGMTVAKGDYFIILDSDCIIPENYLTEVEKFLTDNNVDCFGGPDAAHDSFSDVQKAINQTMTSVLTTGGIRGASEKLGKFQPRSFNMGISKEAFEASGGFGKIHPGEDPDLSIRLWKMNYTTALIPNAHVFHKRRIDWEKFYKQVNKFGKARPILNKRYPEYSKITYWFPAVFMVGFYISLLFLIAGINAFFYCYALYFLALFIETLVKTKSLKISFLTIIATFIQFFGYGAGFLYSYFLLNIKKQDPQIAMPEMFFK